MEAGSAIANMLRRFLYWGAGSLATHGFIAASQVEIVAAFGMTLLTFIWSMYGESVSAKINALLGTGIVETIVLNDKTIAENHPSEKVVPM